MTRAGLRIDDRYGVAGIIDKQLFPGAMLLAQHQIQLSDPTLIQFAEPAVLITVGIGLLVLLPEQLQGEVLMAAQFFMNAGPIR